MWTRQDGKSWSCTGKSLTCHRHLKAMEKVMRWAVDANGTIAIANGQKDEGDNKQERENRE